MTALRPAIAALCLLALVACQSAPSIDAIMPGDAPSGQEPIPVADSMVCNGDVDQAQRMVEAVNNLRGGQGRSLLKTDRKLTEIALKQACDISALGRESVVGADGSGITDRAKAVGFRSCGVGQLVAIGRSADAVIARWFASEGHRIALLEQTNDRIGVGAVTGQDGRMWWSVVIGEKCGLFQGTRRLTGQ
ncbi:CAP domain-containing protein [Paracoccus sp. (in: a-proteobacteria)]|uniref:CAP domain-containing protein n=1 Tax=Paracoccus sp. TaxID=267 RepID=UPI003A8C11A3